MNSETNTAPNAAIDAYTHLHRPGAAGAPLLFVFHGTGGDERQLADLGAELAPGAAVVSPRGDVSEGGAARFFRRAAEGVYDMADLARARVKMASFVRAWTERLNPSAVYGLGYSNGANILAASWIETPELFDKAALLHPLIPWTPAPSPGLAGRRALVASGARDPICPPELTDALIAYLEGQGAVVATERHSGGHEIRPQELSAAQAFLR